MPRARVAAVEDYEVHQDRLSLRCVVEYDEPPGEYALPARGVPVEIVFLTPSVFRFELQGVPEAGASTGVDLDREAVREPVALETTVADGRLRVETAALVVVVGLDTWSFTVETRDGDRLFETGSDRDAKSTRLTDPLGFTAEETNRWPYRTTDAGLSVALGADEHVYGFGEQFTALDKRGQTVEAWVTQANGTNTEHAYKNVPFYLSTAGYGLLVDTNCRVTADVGDTARGTLELTVDDDTLAFVFFGQGEFDDVLETYTGLTGRPPRPPKWSFGLWMSRCAYESREEVESVLDGLDERDIPCDVVHVDPQWLDGLCTLEWDREAFPDPEGFVASLHDRGVRLSLWEYPYLLTDTEAFAEARDAGYLVEDGTGKPYVVSRVSWAQDRGGIVDFTDPDAVEWWTDKHEPLLAMGVDVFKTDFGEYVPEDAVLANGHTGRSMRNPYPNLFTGTVFRTMEKAVGDEALIWARSGWTGGQQYPVHWGGDPDTSFGAMAASLLGGLSLCLSGYGFWSADIGGFRGTPSPELYVRWAAFGLLGTSHARFHGTTPREPWHYGPAAVDAVRTFARERYRLLPHLYTAAEIARRRGIPVMRPLVLEFQDDHGARTCGTELLLGDALLVAPVLDSGGQRDVYLPDAEWVDYWTGEQVAGGRTHARDVDLDEIPVYLRAGRLVPRQDPDHGVADGLPDSLELYGTLADGTASGDVYDEDAEVLRRPTVATDDGTLRIDTDGLDAERVVLRAVTEPGPDHVIADGNTLEAVDGESLEAVDEPLESGQWTYEADDATVRVWL